MVMRAPFRFLPVVARLVSDQSGQILIMFTIMLPVMMGVVGLSLEVGRYWLLNNQLQNLADAAALAGAKKLDGSTNAIVNATDAAEAVSASSSNYPWWSESTSYQSGDVEILDPPTFYILLKGMLDDTGKPAPSDVVVNTSDPAQVAQARFIKVTTVIHNIIPKLLIAVGAISPKQTLATATAGTTYVACNVQPLMLCNPNEPNQFSANPGDLFGFTASGGTGGYSPGDFNLLDPAGQTHSGAQQIKQLLSSTNPDFCYVDNVSPAQGQKTQNVADGINVRLDIPPGGNSNGVDTTPAPNIIKGEIPNSNCKNFTATTPPAPMPLDINMTKVGSAWVGTQANGATMDPTGADDYWHYHHNPSTSWPSGVTRYQMYQNERAATDPTYNFLPGTESPNPSCAAVPTGDDSRRIVSVAIVNCLAQNLSGNSTKVVMANSYADFFLIRPVQATGSPNPPNYAGVIWLEFIKTVTPHSGTGNNLHQIVQLYRDY